MGLDVTAVLKKARKEPLAWVTEVEDRLDNGFLGEPENHKVDSYKTGKTYVWVELPPNNVAKHINAKIIEQVSWWANNLMDYRTFCLENERFDYADKSADVLDGYVDFVLKHCPNPVKGYYQFHDLQSKANGKFGIDACVLYYKAAAGLVWTKTEEKPRRRR